MRQITIDTNILVSHGESVNGASLVTSQTRHPATGADLYRGLLFLGLGMTTVNAAMLSAAVAVIQLT